LSSANYLGTFTRAHSFCKVKMNETTGSSQLIMNIGTEGALFIKQARGILV